MCAPITKIYMLGAMNKNFPYKLSETFNDEKLNLYGARKDILASPKAR